MKCKSFPALDLAVAIASGRPALRRFSVRQPGRVLRDAAEDAEHIVRARLDLERDRRLLEEAVAALRPRLLILDPVARLLCIEQNSSSAGASATWVLSEISPSEGLRSYPTDLIGGSHPATAG